MSKKRATLEPLPSHYNGLGLLRPTVSVPLASDDFMASFRVLWEEHVDFGTSRSHKRSMRKTPTHTCHAPGSALFIYTHVTQRVQPQSATRPAAHRPDRTLFRRQPRTRRARTRLLTVRPRALHDCTDRTPRRQVSAPATPSTQTCSCVIEARLDGFGGCSAVCSPNLGGGGCGEASRRGPPPRPRHPAQASPADLWLATTCR